MQSRLFLLLVFLFPASLAGVQLEGSFNRALSLDADPVAGKAAYLARCSQCHGEDAWGSYSGEYPQLAGQHPTVIIKQLADIHSGARRNPAMHEVVAVLAGENAQMVSDIAAHLSSLPMNPYPEWGEADDPDVVAPLFRKRCARCHGEQGAGDAARFIPRLQGQHYEYLLRQLHWLRDGSRGNAHPEMVEVLAAMTEQQLKLLADYLSRLLPPEALLGEG